MKEQPLSAEQAVALLRENAAQLASLTAGVPPERLHAAPPGEWSANDILAHMRACCDTWGGNIARILADEHASFAGMNPRAWMKKTDYPTWQFADAHAAFAQQREALLETLAALPPAHWERTATVRAYGQFNERTLRSYASQLATHERTHVGQMARALG